MSLLSVSAAPALVPTMICLVMPTILPISVIICGGNSGQPCGPAPLKGKFLLFGWLLAMTDICISPEELAIPKTVHQLISMHGITSIVQHRSILALSCIQAYRLGLLIAKQTLCRHMPNHQKCDDHAQDLAAVLCCMSLGARASRSKLLSFMQKCHLLLQALYGVTPVQRRIRNCLVLASDRCAGKAFCCHSVRKYCCTRSLGFRAAFHSQTAPGSDCVGKPKLSGCISTAGVPGHGPSLSHGCLCYLSMNI